MFNRMVFLRAVLPTETGETSAFGSIRLPVVEGGD